MIMVSFQKVKIKDYCEITSSKRIFADEYLSSGVPFYRGKEISEKQRSSAEVSDLIYISRDKFEEIKAKYGVPQKGDLLLTSVGTIGNPYLVKENEEFYFKDGNLTWFRNFHGINGQWLYYWLLSPQGKSELNKCTIGSSQKAYTINLLYGLQIELPELPTQTRIASVLSAYDDLIENNEKRIKALEQMSQLLYTEWFIKFKFPGHEKEKMINSGTEYGMIPEGWKVGKISELVNVISGFPFKGSTYQESGKYKIVTIKNVHDGKFVLNFDSFIDDLPSKLPENCILNSGDILLSLTGNVGRICVVYGSDYLLNQRVAKLNPTGTNKREYIYLLFRQKRFQQKLEGMSNGAAQQNLSPIQVKDVKVIIPSSEILNEFSHLVKKHFDLVLSLQDENQNLSQIRDLLIPQLVTGKRELK